jgi:hypothetical protein
MKIRNLLFAALPVALTSSAFATFTGYLWFENHTTGVGATYPGTDAVWARPGDEIWVDIQMGPGSGSSPNRWLELDMTMDLSGPGGLAISDAEANTWGDQLTAAFLPASSFPTEIYGMPSGGSLYDNPSNPYDAGYMLVTTRGVTALIGCSVLDQQTSFAANGIFKFHVAAGAVLGSELHWRGDKLSETLPTTYLNNKAQYVRPEMNYLLVVPEPGTVAALGMGLVGLLALRRRK